MGRVRLALAGLVRLGLAWACIGADWWLVRVRVGGASPKAAEQTPVRARVGMNCWGAQLRMRESFNSPSSTQRTASGCLFHPANASPSPAPPPQPAQTLISRRAIPAALSSCVFNLAPINLPSRPNSGHLCVRALTTTRNSRLLGLDCVVVRHLCTTSRV